MTNKKTATGLLRQFMAIFYDSLLLLSALFFAAALAYPITHGQVSLIFQIYLLTVCFFYFAWPWLHGGQTLGMKTWRIQLQSNQDRPITKQQVLLRFSIAIVSWLALGIGFFGSLWINNNGPGMIGYQTHV
ncbi:conserved hypothetical protein, membrane [Beggiatoa sp. PS]|nr:conserved hypothetical protein, membrane [Beggiatoa sp. PS]